jgi:hypothetical protein
MRCEGEPDDESHSEQGDRVLHLEADADEDADEEPPARIFCVDKTKDAPGAGHPQQWLEGVHGEPVLHEHVDWRGEDGDSGESLGNAGAAHHAGHGAGEPDERGSGERGQEAQSDERGAEDVTREPRDEGHQGRMVDVAPAQVLTTGQVVHLVAKNAVMRRGTELESEFEDRDGRHNCRAGGEPTLGMR